MKKCSVPACPNLSKSRGWCSAHYARWKRDGDLGDDPIGQRRRGPKPTGERCRQLGCDRRAFARGLCQSDWQRWRRALRTDQEKATALGRRRVIHAERYASDEAFRRKAQESSAARHAKIGSIRSVVNGNHQRASRLGSLGSFSRADWKSLVRRYEGRCAYCRESCKPTIDHVVPLSRGGSNFIGNILPACLRCNTSKHDLLQVEWRQRQMRIAA